MEIPSRLAALLRLAPPTAVLTGAGISQESGLRTFREAQTGLWAQYRPEDLATPQAFARDPRTVWEWYALRREKVREVQPNPGHLALAEMARRIPDFHLLTQNVDGLHQRAGNRQVIELHGNITRVRCSSACGVIENWEEKRGGVPLCPRCGALLRPDVVWFGETLPPAELERALQAARTCKLFFSIGTSGLVQPAASLPHLARTSGAALVEINADSTPLTQMVDFSLPGRSGEILPALVRAAWG